MPQHKLYGLFWSRPSDGAPMWAMHRNGRRARRIARSIHALLTAMPLPTRDARVWDAPTFRALSDEIVDYRLKETDHATV